MANVLRFFDTGQSSVWEKYVMVAHDLFSDSMNNAKKLDWNIGATKAPNVISARISKTPTNGVTINKFIEKGKSHDELRRMTVTVMHPDVDTVRLGDIKKDLLKGDAPLFNKGYLGEGVLACALTARFVNKLGRITEKHITDILAQTLPRGGKINQTFKGPNKNPAITDDVQLLINLASNDMDALHKKEIISGPMKGIVKAAAKYANGLHVTEYAEMIYCNNRYDKIVVDSDGLGNQKGTKVDIRVKINGEPTTLNISLKTSGVGQIGGVSGGTFEKFKTLWEPLGVIMNTNIEDDFNKWLQKGDHYGGIVSLYENVASQLQLKLQGPSGATFFDDLGTFVLYHLTRSEPNVDLLDLDKGDYKLYKFGDLQTRLSNLRFKVVTDTSLNKKLIAWKAKTQKSPTLYIASNQSDDPTKDYFISIRSAIEGRENKPYFRNKVEKGKEMFKYLGEMGESA